MYRDPGHVRGHRQAQTGEVQLQRRERDAAFRVPHDYALVVRPRQGHRTVTAQLDTSHMA